MSLNGHAYFFKPGWPYTADCPCDYQRANFEKCRDGVRQTIGKGIQMLSLNAVGVLLPAIPLAIVALNFRYTSLAGLMRELHAQLDKNFLKPRKKKSCATSSK